MARVRGESLMLCGPAAGTDHPGELGAMDFTTLHALAHEWDARWRGATLTDAWTQAPSELTLAIETARGESDALRVLCDPSLTLVWRSPGGGRKKAIMRCGR